MLAQYRLEEVSPQEVAFSRSNPRGEKPEEIEKDPTFQQLKDSVYQFGVLVPIVVHEYKGGRGKRYRLVDGERRLRAALATKLEMIPAHIAPPGAPGLDLIEAFHIHMLRKQWRAVAQTRALKRILKDFREKHPTGSKEEALEELQIRTGCSDTRLKALRRASNYPDSVLDEIGEGDFAFSHLVQIEESFIEQLDQRYPGLLKDLGRRKVRDVLLDKVRKRILTDTRALMENVVPVIQRAETKAEKDYVKKLLERFIRKPNMSAENVLERFERRFPLAKKDLVDLASQIATRAEDLAGLLHNLKPADLRSFPKAAKEVEVSLQDLRVVLNKRLRTLKAT